MTVQLRAALRAPFVVGDSAEIADFKDIVDTMAAAVIQTTTGPGVGDDSDDGYEIGDLWLDTTAGKSYQVFDVTVGAAVWKELTAGAAGGETNTCSNIGTAGVGVFKQKAGVDFEFKKINAGSAKITITDDTGDNELDVDFGSVAITDLSDVASKTGSGTAAVFGTAPTFTTKIVTPEVENSGNITIDAINAAADSTVSILNSDATYNADLDVEGDITVGGTVDTRDLATDGTKLDGVEAAADVTDATNVAAAGAVMDGDFSVSALMVRTGAGTYTSRSIAGTTDQIALTNGDGVSGDPTVALASDPVVPGTGAMTLPDGTTGQRPGTPANGMTRYNTTSNKFEAYENGAWTDMIGGGGGLSNVVEDTTPQLGGMLDVNAQSIGDGTRELLAFIEDASAVNHLEIENEATGSGPILRATGDDANVDLHLDTKGTGNVKCDDDLDVTGNITVTGTVDGRDVATDGTKLDGVETSADVTDETNVTAALPVSDATSLVKDPADGTKQVRLDVGAVATATVRVLTMPDQDIDLTPGTGSFATEAEGGLAATALQNVVDDTTPQLGGNLDVNGNSIVSAAAGDIAITPDTTGDVILDGLKWPQADGTTGQVLKTDGVAQLSWTTAGSGDVSAGANITDNAVVRGDGGVKGVQDSGVIIDDSDFVTGIAKLTLAKSVELQLGTSREAVFVMDNGANDSFQVGIRVGGPTNTGYFSIMEELDVGAAAREPSGFVSNPTLRIYSADVAQAADYIELSHDQTDGLIAVGNGDLLLTSGGVVKANGSQVTVGPGTTLDNSLVRFDGTTGTIQGSGLTVSDAKNLGVPGAAGWKIEDESANELLDFLSSGTPVTYLQVKSGDTGAGPTLSALGEANTDLLLVANGTGVVKADGVEVATISGTQTLTNKTIDGDNNTVSNLAHGAEVDEPSSGVHGVSGSLVGTTDTQTLTNKTITAAANTLTIAIADLSDVSALTGTGTVVVAQTSPTVKTSLLLDGSTSGTLTFKPAAAVTSHTLTMPAAQGTAGTYLKNDGAGALTWETPAGGGDVVGPASSTDLFIARFDGTTGKLLKDGPLRVTDAGQVDFVTDLLLTGNFYSSTYGTKLIGLVPIASAVNYIELTSAIAGSEPTIAATGTDTDVDLLLTAKGAGVVKADGVEVTTISGTQTLTNKTLTTPTIGDLTNATHDHSNAAGGAQITLTTGVTGTLPVANGGTNRTAAPTRPLILMASGGMGTSTTGGGDANQLPEQRELATNDINIHYLAMATGETVFWNVVMPENWNAGTMAAIFYWTSASGTDDVKFEVQGRAFADNDALDQAQGTAVSVEDTVLASDDVHETAATSAMTLAGTPAAGEYCVFEVKRVAPAGTDKAGDVQLLGVKLQYTASGYSES